MITSYHKPALLKECIHALSIDPDGIFVDATFGGGGHSAGILKKLKTGKLFAFDQDPEALNHAIRDERFLLLRQNFRYLKNNLRLHNALPIHGLIADLGVSSHQLEKKQRGFSLNDKTPLDMRMNPGQKLTAAQVLNHYSEDQLVKIFRAYGEVSNPNMIAKAIVKKRRNGMIACSEDLNACLMKYASGRKQKFLAKIYQALRIEVNDELNALKELLMQCTEVIRPGGRVVIISYHSLEDRIVKNFMHAGNFGGDKEKDFYGRMKRPFRPVNKKIIRPSEQEISENKRVRSARMRIAEKI